MLRSLVGSEMCIRDRGGHRQANGYFELQVVPESGTSSSYQVELRQAVRNSLLTGNITASNGARMSNLSIWVNADLALPVVVLQCTGECSVAWFPAAKTDFEFKTWRSGGELVVLAAIQAPSDPPAKDVIAAAARSDLGLLLGNHTLWWDRYWHQSFVTLPSTTAQQLYYVQMHRFPASDRVGLHGLMGAFGPTGEFNLWPDDVWDMNEQVMYWIGAASNRPEISSPMEKWFEAGNRNGGLWMAHNYIKQLRFEGDSQKLQAVGWSAIIELVRGQVGSTQASPGRLTLMSDRLYHVLDCSSPEYNCYPPYASKMCTPSQDCNYDLAQIRWGLRTALSLTAQFGLETKLKAAGVDQSWWESLLGSELVWYPHDNGTGFRLDAHCRFECPHRHFSHLLQIYDLETVAFSDNGGAPRGLSADFEPGLSDTRGALNQIMLDSIDQWYRVTCNGSNWFNEECRGFTQCALAAMNVLVGRPAAAQGNLSRLIQSVITPNGMYGEMVYQSHPDEFSPVSESAYCGAAVLNTMLLHTDPQSRVLRIFPGFGPTWSDGGFYKLRADGGLVVSARRASGTTQFVGVGVASGTVVTTVLIQVSGWTEGVQMASTEGCKLVPGGSPTRWSLTIGGSCLEAVLWIGTRPGTFEVLPVLTNETEQNWFGYNRPMQPLH
eukprot:TRINITY_DN3430_c0_g1_i10.p1 TRINITY_DN3430_c0_g1~~TRINITY_DN3430_c0_g1_i10.p1  ORF type:complete len:700 (-),score=109.31 TRINITY_DN3430_c0_g1_i10:79-2070(-)